MLVEGGLSEELLVAHVVLADPVVVEHRERAALRDQCECRRIVKVTVVRAEVQSAAGGSLAGVEEAQLNQWISQRTSRIKSHVVVAGVGHDPLLGARLVDAAQRSAHLVALLFGEVQPMLGLDH